MFCEEVMRNSNEELDVRPDIPLPTAEVWFALPIVEPLGLVTMILCSRTAGLCRFLRYLVASEDWLGGWDDRGGDAAARSAIVVVSVFRWGSHVK